MLSLRDQVFSAKEEYTVLSVLPCGQAMVKAFARSSRGDKVRITVLATAGMNDRQVEQMRALIVSRSALPLALWPQLRESNVQGGHLYLIETLPEGALLAECSKGGRGLDARTLMTFMLAITKVLEEAHQQGLSHKQIWPGTLYLINQDWRRPMLLDLGESELLPPVDSDQMDPLRYAPPERFGHVSGGNGPAADLYALGMVLYELATKSLPVRGSTLADIARSVYTSVPDPLHAVVPGMPTMLSDIVVRLMRKSPGDRYQSARGLAADVEQCLSLLDKPHLSQSFALGRHDHKRELNYKIPLVGRHREFTSLSRGLESAARGQGTLQLIAAPSGMGKTRLAREILSAAAQADFTTFTVKFSSFEVNVPLCAINRLIRDHAAMVRQLPTEVRLAWQNRLLVGLGSRGQLLSKRLDFCQDIFPVFPAHAVLAREEEERIFFQTFAQYISLLDTRGRGTYIFIDDWQWCDALSVTLLKQVAILAQTQPLGLVHLIGAYRSEEVNPQHPLSLQVLPQIRSAEQLTLNALDAHGCSDLVEALLDERSPFVDELKGFVHAVSGGVPFFVYQVLETMLHHGIVALGANGAWSFDTQRAQAQISASDMRQLINQRLKQLSDIELTLIKVASIAGASIAIDALYQIYNGHLRYKNPDFALDLSTDEIIKNGLDQLRHKHLIAKRQDQLVFAHDRIVRGAFDLLGADERKELHYDYGVYLSDKLLKAQGLANSRDIFEAAYHFMAGHPERSSQLAITVLTRAGERAVRLFAYRKAKEYLELAVKLSPAVPPKDTEVVDDQTGWHHLMELYADALSVADDPRMAINIYTTLLEWTRESYRRAAIYGKIARNHLFLFRYDLSVEAGNKGLGELRAKYVTSDLKSLLMIALGAPRFVATLLWFWLFGKQTREVSGKAEQAALDLLMNILVPGYFMKPLGAIANFMAPTCRLLFYKDCRFRALMFGYWGIATASLGLEKISRRCFDRTQDYLDREPNPVDQAFIYMTRGYLLELPLGNVALARDYVHRSLRITQEIGESFWQVLAHQAVIDTDFFAFGDGAGVAAAEHMVDIYRRASFEPTVMASTLRIWQGLGRMSEFHHWRQLVDSAHQRFQASGFETIDAIYAATHPGEILLRGGNAEQALPRLSSGLKMSLKHAHRVVYCCYCPILLAQALTRCGHHIRALVPLFVAWFDVALGVRLFLPQTLFATGEVAQAFGFRRSAESLMRRSIRYAMGRGWHGPANDLRVLFARFLLSFDPEAALFNLSVAKQHFQSLGQSFHVAECAALMVSAEGAFDALFPAAQGRLLAALTPSGEQVPALKRRLETSAVIDMFLTLSEASTLEHVATVALQVAADCTGADHGVLFLPEAGGWRAVASRGLPPNASLATERLGETIDTEFLNSIRPNLDGPCIRPLQGPALDAEAVMVVPMLYERTCYGLAYLGHRQIRELFEQQSLEVLSSLTTQIAITLCNFQLLAKVQGLNAELEQSLSDVEAEVSRRTSDIRSMFQAIELGVLVVRADFSIHDEFSAHLAIILETEAIAGRSIIDVLFANTLATDEQRSLTSSALASCLGEEAWIFDLNKSWLPQEIIRMSPVGGQKILELQWNPVIAPNGVIDRILLVLRDVTHLRELTALADQGRRNLTMIGELLGSDADLCGRYLDAAATDLQAILTLIQGTGSDSSSSTTLKLMFIKLHTIKGLARTLCLSFLSAAAHQAESGFAAQRQVAASWEPSGLRRDLAEVEAVLASYQHLNTHVLKRHVHAADLPAATPLRTFAGESAQHIFSQWFARIDDLARELGKPAPQVKIEVDEGLCLPPTSVNVLTKAMVHIIRNAMDHGIESPLERQRSGKNPAGSLYLQARQAGATLVLRFADDGSGLDLVRLRQQAVLTGLMPAEAQLSPQRLAELIFAPGLSTAPGLSQTSGRGVGMDAVRTILEQHGGEVQVIITSTNADRALFVFEIKIPLPAAQLSPVAGRKTA